MFAGDIVTFSLGEIGYKESIGQREKFFVSCSTQVAQNEWQMYHRREICHPFGMAPNRRLARRVAALSRAAQQNGLHRPDT